MPIVTNARTYIINYITHPIVYCTKYTIEPYFLVISPIFSRKKRWYTYVQHGKAYVRRVENLLFGRRIHKGRVPPS